MARITYTAPSVVDRQERVADNPRLSFVRTPRGSVYAGLKDAVRVMGSDLVRAREGILRALFPGDIAEFRTTVMCRPAKRPAMASPMPEAEPEKGSIDSCANLRMNGKSHEPIRLKEKIQRAFRGTAF